MTVPENNATPPVPGVAPARQSAAYLRHQLLTPLNHIIGYSEMLEEDALEFNQPSFINDLQKIQSAARSLLGLLETEFQHSARPGTAPGQRPEPEGPKAGRPDEANVQRHTFSRHVHPAGHVLIVDDVEANRDILARRLKSRGLTVETAENGRQALAALARSAFDAVLLDVMMPELDGYPAASSSPRRNGRTCRLSS